MTCQTPLTPNSNHLTAPLRFSAAPWQCYDQSQTDCDVDMKGTTLWWNTFFSVSECPQLAEKPWLRDGGKTTSVQLIWVVRGCAWVWILLLSLLLFETRKPVCNSLSTPSAKC